MTANQEPQYKDSDGSAIRVFVDTAPNAYLTEREGRPIFDEVIYVEVISPGSRGSQPVFEAERVFSEEMGRPPRKTPHYEKYKKFVEDFKAGTENADLTGTPLSEWPEISVSLAASLRAQSIYTVEALAALPDNRLTVVGPDGRTWRTKALTYIENAKDSGYATRLAADIENLRADIQQRDETISQMQARIQELENEGPEMPPVEASMTLPDLGSSPKAKKAAQAEPLV